MPECQSDSAPNCSAPNTTRGAARSGGGDGGPSSTHMEAVSVEEHARGALDADKLGRIVETYHRDGLCVLANVLPHAMLDALAHRYDFDCAHRYVHGDPFKGNQKGPALDPAYDGNLHLQLNLPRCHPYVQPEIVANPIIEQIAVAVLRGPVFIRYFNGNSALPGATVQALHVDTQGAPGMKLAVNFGVEDITPENAATEVWPGSHRGTLKPMESLDLDGNPKHAAMQAERRATPGLGPVQLAIPKGGVCLRDLRVWHRAMPNPSPHPRHMYYLSYSADTAR